MVILASRIPALIVIHDVMIRDLVVSEQRWNRDLAMYLYVKLMRCPRPTSREETRDKGRAAAGALPCPGKGEPATPSRGKLLQCTGAPSCPHVIRGSVHLPSCTPPYSSTRVVASSQLLTASISSPQPPCDRTDPKPPSRPSSRDAHARQSPHIKTQWPSPLTWCAARLRAPLGTQPRHLAHPTRAAIPSQRSSPSRHDFSTCTATSSPRTKGRYRRLRAPSGHSHISSRADSAMQRSPRKRYIRAYSSSHYITMPCSGEPPPRTRPARRTVPRQRRTRGIPSSGSTKAASIEE